MTALPAPPAPPGPAGGSVRSARRPLLRRVPVGVWSVLAWGVGVASVLVVLIPLPGESPRDFRPGLDLPPGNQVLLLLAAALTVLGGVLLRRMPLTGLSVLLAGGVCTAMVHNSLAIQVQNFLACDLALWFVAATRPVRQVRAAGALTVAVVVGHVAARLAMGWSVDTPSELSVLLTALVSILLGRFSQQAREHEAERAVHATEQAVAGERLRIARELHDMVAHTLGIVALQSGAARRVITTQPDRARDALGAVEEASRETLAGLRRMLVVLRAADRPGSVGAPLHPAPGLGDLSGLAAATTDAGVRVDLDVDGDLSHLPPEVQLAAYRIVQESLTNVVRHAEALSCRVLVSVRDEDLRVEVTDAGCARPSGRGGEPRPAGFGLVGMRERVDLLGGAFEAGPRSQGGFRVSARLPLLSAVTPSGASG
ncbi:sensor histidine kinase [Streptacidiphilus jiangxiensis]|nr:sensor histidine kinase [Streptacidiphilus jiangxiensis]